MSYRFSQIPDGDASELALSCVALTGTAVKLRERQMTETGKCSLSVPTRLDDVVEWHKKLTSFIEQLEKELKITDSAVPKDKPTEQNPGVQGKVNYKGKNLTEICLAINGKTPVAPPAPIYTGLTAEIMAMKAAGKK